MSHNYSTASNNPQDWFGSDYTYSTNMGGEESMSLALNLEEAIGDVEGTGYDRKGIDGFTNYTMAMSLPNVSGDVRYVYHVLLRYLWDKYHNKDQDTSHVMPEGLKMTRNAIRDRDKNRRYVTYTVSFIENESSVTDTVGSRTITPENNL